MDGDQLLRVPVGERAEQDGINHAENRGICANAEGKRDGDDEGKPWRMAKAAEGVTKIEEDAVHGGLDSGVERKVEGGRPKGMMRSPRPSTFGLMSVSPAARQR